MCNHFQDKENQIVPRGFRHQQAFSKQEAKKCDTTMCTAWRNHSVTAESCCSFVTAVTLIIITPRCCRNNRRLPPRLPELSKSTEVAQSSVCSRKKKIT